MRSDAKLVVNLTRGGVVCEHAVIADRALRRMRGLLGRRILPEGEGILLRPAPSIHTAFMRFPIDAIFVDRDLEVLKVVRDLRPWRVASASGARSVLELAAGESAARGLELGDRLAVIDVEVAAHVGLPNVAAPTVNGFAHAHAHALPNSEAPSNGGARVLLVGSDHRFRAATTAVLTRRGCTVTASQDPANLSALAQRDHAEVVVIDAGTSLTAAAREAASIEALDSSIGVLIVSDERDLGLVTMPVLAKWDSLDALFAAIERARQSRDQSGDSGAKR